MKKILVVVSCVFLLFASCKKEKQQAPAYYITADIDGNTVGFTVNNLAEVSQDAYKINKLYVYGATGFDSNSAAIAINLSVKPTIAKGSTFTGSLDDSQYVGISYVPGPFSPTQANDYISDFADAGVAVTITSLNDETIQGTFRGVVTNNGDSKSITNGKFNLPLR